MLPRDGQHGRLGLRVLRDGAEGWEETPPTAETYRDSRRREMTALAQWARGEIDEYRCDAHLAIRTEEILMAFYESARSHSLVRLPLKTMASPLIEMIRGGDLPVRHPGRYDIRHRTTTPTAYTPGARR